MVFLWFSYGFPMVFLWIPWFSWLLQPPPVSQDPRRLGARGREAGAATGYQGAGEVDEPFLASWRCDARRKRRERWEKARKTNPEKPEGIDCWLRVHEYFMNLLHQKRIGKKMSGRWCLKPLKPTGRRTCAHVCKLDLVQIGTTWDIMGKSSRNGDLMVIWMEYEWNMNGIWMECWIIPSGNQTWQREIHYESRVFFGEIHL